MFEENQLLSIQHQWVESIGGRGTELHLPGIPLWMYGPRLVPEINSPRRSALKKATCSLYTGGKLEVKITILDCIPSCQTLFQLPVGFGPYAVLVTAYNPQLHPPSQAIGCRNKAGGFAVNRLEYTFGAGEKPLLSRLGHYR